MKVRYSKYWKSDVVDIPLTSEEVLELLDALIKWRNIQVRKRAFNKAMTKLRNANILFESREKQK